MPIIKKIEFINKKKFAIVVLDMDNKTFVIYMTALDIIIPNIYPSQIVQIRLLKANKVLIIIFVKYFDYTNIFLPEFIVKLLKYIKIYNNDLKLVKDKQLSYGLIYSLKLMELEILKAQNQLG